MKKERTLLIEKIYRKVSIGIWLLVFMLTLPLIAAAQGKIAFVRQENIGTDIFLMNPDGSNPVNITNTAAGEPNSDEGFPAFSSDGTKIVFTAGTDVWVMNSDGSNRLRLTNGLIGAGAPKFSPDSSKIVFYAFTNPANADIYLMNANGSNLIRLTNSPGADGNPAFSPDGNKIVFTSSVANSSDIFLMNPDGSNQINLTNSPGISESYPSFNPIDGKIMFMAGPDFSLLPQQIYVMNPDGSNPIQLTNDSLFKRLPAFSFDGSKIVFDATEEGDIWAMNADGSNLVNLTGGSLTFDHAASWGNPPPPPDITPPVITPNVVGTLGNNGWFVSDAELSWTIVDNESPISSQTGCQNQVVNVDSDANGFTILCTATSTGGTNSQIVTIRRDTIPPLLEPSASPFPVFLNGTVNISPNATDAASGIATQSCEPANTSVLGIFLVNCTATDFAGNTNNSPARYEVVSATDNTPPQITADMVGTYGNHWFRSDVQLSWTVVDNESPISNQTGCDAHSITNDTNGITFSCSATSFGGTNTLSVTIKRDTTAPNITFNNRTSPNSNGWNNTDVTVNWDCTDQLSGAVNPSVSQILTAEGANQSATGTCFDQPGNSVSLTQSAINIDKTPPTLAPVITPNPVVQGGIVAVNPNAADARSGIFLQSCDPVNTSAVGNFSVNCTATDLAGNTTVAPANYQVVAANDTTPPVITPNINGTLGQNGWYVSDVQVTWTVVDNESPISNQTGCESQSITIDTVGLNFVCNATSAGGENYGIGVVIRRDATPPIHSFDRFSSLVNANGWYNSPVFGIWNCSDQMSGVARQTSLGVVTDGENQSVSNTCTDYAGNTSTNTQTGINLDLTPPTLAPVVNPNPVFVNGTATATPNAADTLSGIATQSCNPVITSAVGSFTINCTATDLAGNTANAPANYQVIYNFGGFFNPIDNPPAVNNINAGRPILIKFRLNGNYGLNILAPGFPASGGVQCHPTAQPATLQPTVNQGAGLTYDTTTGQYKYHWRTDSTWAGTCRQFQLKLIDGTTHVAYFQFR